MTTSDLIYYGYDEGTAWAFSTPDELAEWAAQHPNGKWDVGVRKTNEEHK